MKKYLAYVLVTVIAWAALQMCLFEGQLGVPTETSRWIEESYQRKIAYAESINGNKIVVISGSNGLFAVSAEQMERDLEWPVVNLSVHAGLKLEYILHRAQAVLKPGDIALLPLEYEMYTYEGETSETLSDFLASRDVGYLRQDFTRYLNTAFSFGMGELVWRNVQRVGRRAPVCGFYDASYLNRWGDKTNIQVDLVTAKERELLGGFDAIRWEFNRRGRAADVLREFMQQCGRRGVEVVLSFPTTMYFEEYEDTAFARNVEDVKAFAVEAGASVLGSPLEFAYPMRYFLNTNYHTHDGGRAATTRRLVELMKGFLSQRVSNSSSRVSRGGREERVQPEERRGVGARIGGRAGVS